MRNEVLKPVQSTECPYAKLVPTGEVVFLGVAPGASKDAQSGVRVSCKVTCNLNGQRVNASGGNIPEARKNAVRAGENQISERNAGFGLDAMLGTSLSEPHTGEPCSPSYAAMEAIEKYS
mgnify:CR=1 FL=1